MALLALLGKRRRALVYTLFAASLAGCSLPTERTAEVVDPFMPTRTATTSPAAAQPLPDLVALPPVQQASFVADAPSDDVPAIRLPESIVVPEPGAPAAPLDAGTPPGASPTDAMGDTLGPQQRLTANPGELGPAVSGVYPIDLANALGLGGADNLQVRLARTQLFQAQARHLAAKTLWLPSLRLGIGYSKHDGRLQETEGNVLEINRNSTFVGGGLGLASPPLPGGAGGPPRMFVALSTADAVFAPLAACQEVSAHGAGERVAQNDALGEIAVGYHTLVEAQGRLANAVYAQNLAERLVAQVTDFEREGFSSKTEISRAQTAAAAMRSDIAEARRRAVAASADLARVLRLPPQIQLVPAEDVPLPLDLVDPVADVELLVGQAVANRPEIARLAAFREAACWRVKQEQWRPWIPNVQVGASAGEFGGGPSSDYLNNGSRSDVEVLGVWEWQNMGFGNVALQRERRGELHELTLQIERQREQIAAEVVAAAADVASYREQIEIAQSALDAAHQSYELNDLRIRESEGLPIELLQSISALTAAQNAYTEAVANYNRAQYRLLRAIGTPAN